MLSLNVVCVVSAFVFSLTCAMSFNMFSLLRFQGSPLCSVCWCSTVPLWCHWIYIVCTCVVSIYACHVIQCVLLAQASRHPPWWCTSTNCWSSSDRPSWPTSTLRQGSWWRQWFMQWTYVQTSWGEWVTDQKARLLITHKLHEVAVLYYITHLSSVCREI